MQAVKSKLTTPPLWWESQWLLMYQWRLHWLWYQMDWTSAMSYSLACKHHWQDQKRSFLGKSNLQWYCFHYCCYSHFDTLKPTVTQARVEYLNFIGLAASKSYTVQDIWVLTLHRDRLNHGKSSVCLIQPNQYWVHQQTSLLQFFRWPARVVWFT